MKRTFKKAISVFLVVAMLLCDAPLNGLVGLDLPSLFDFKVEAATYSGTCGNNLTWSLDAETGVLEINGTGTMTDYSGSLPVPWSSYLSHIKSIIISNGVTTIGDSAFRDCINLKNVTIGNNVTSIGWHAFDYCYNLTSVTIGKSVKNIENSAFYFCSNLASIIIPDSVTSIGELAFYHCINLKSITIPDSVANIGDGAFRDCDILTSITIPDSTISIGEGVFYDTGYYRCSDNWVNNVLYVGNHLVQTKTTLSGSYTIKNNTLTIADNAFYHCKELTSITIPDRVTRIGNDAFKDCTGLNGITISDSVTTIGYSAFYNTGYYNDAENWVDGVLYIGNHLIQAKTTLSGSYTIKNNTLTIGNSAFVLCSNLANIIIPDSVTSIGECAFDRCINLTSITIPDSVANIGDGAFHDCESLTNITIPNSIKEIGQETFFYCENLTSVTIGNNVTSIGDYAFYHCDSLTNITIQGGVTNIGNYAFYYCDSLTSITIQGGVTNIGNYAFYYCDSLTSITILDGATNIGNYAFYRCNSLTNIKIPNSVTNIGNGAFYDCDGLTSVTIGNNVTSIDAYMFYFCDSLTSITIPDGVTNIGNYAFYCCDSLTNIKIPNSVTSIGDSAFGNCDSLTSIEIPNSVTSIGDEAFRDCGNLTSISVDTDNPSYSSDERGVLFNKNKTALIQYPARNSGASYEIPDSVTTIGDYAFYWCYSLTSVTIPDSVTSIGNYAFYACNRLDDVYYSSTEEQWDKISFGSNNTLLLNATIHFNSTGPNDVPSSDEPEELSHLFFKSSTDYLKINETANLSLLYENGKQYSGNVEWLSSDSDILQITSADGNSATVKAIDNGKAVISAITDSKTISFEINTGYIHNQGISFKTDTKKIICSDPGVFDKYGFKLSYSVGNYMYYPEGCDLTSQEKREIESALKMSDLSVKYTLPIGLTFKPGNSAARTLTKKLSDLPCGRSVSNSVEVCVLGTATCGEKKIKAELYSGSDLISVQYETVTIVDRTDFEDVSELTEIKPNGKQKTLTQKEYIYNGDLVIGNDINLYIPNKLVVNGDLIVSGNGKISVGGELFVNGDLNIKNGSVVINSKAEFDCNAVTVKKGELIVNGRLHTGNVNIKGGKVRLGGIMESEGGVKFSGSGSIIMNGTSETKLIAKKDFIMKTSGAVNTFSGGQLWIGGNLEQSKSKSNLVCSDAFETIFFGKDKTHEIDYQAKTKMYLGKLYREEGSKTIPASFNSQFYSKYMEAECNTDTYSVKGVKDILLDYELWLEGLKACKNQKTELTINSYIGIPQYIYDQKSLDEFEKAVAIWYSILSSTAVNDRFDDITTSAHFITLKNVPVKGPGGKKSCADIDLKAYGVKNGGGSSLFKIECKSNDLSDLYNDSDFKSYSMIGFGTMTDKDTMMMQLHLYLSVDYLKYVLNFAIGDSVLWYLNDKHYEDIVQGIMDTVSLVEVQDVYKKYQGFMPNSSSDIDSISEPPITEETEKIEFAIENINGTDLEYAIKKALNLTDDFVLSDDLLSGIFELDLSDMGLVDITGIEKLANLKKLNLSCNNVYDISPLSGLRKLEQLDISDNLISNVSAVKNLKNLVVLDVSDNFIIDISPMSELSNLKILNISQNQIFDASVISDISGLESLDISENDISDFDFNALNNLKYLDASDCNLTALENLNSEYIIEIDISGNEIKEMPTSLSNSLEKIDVSFNEISSTQWIPGSSVLNELNISNNPISDITGITAAENLEILNMQGCDLSDTKASTLAGLTGLKRLNVSENEITNLDFISEMTNLKELDASDNPLSDITGLSELTEIEKVDLENNKIIYTEENTEIIQSIPSVTLGAFGGTIKVTGINSFETDISLLKGDTHFFKASVLPYAASNKKIIWSTSNPSCVSVEDGLITALTSGKSVITATTDEGGYAASFNVTVTALEYTITWIVDDKESVQTYEEDMTITKPVTPVKTGYKFIGWDKTVPSKMPSNDLTFTAQFELLVKQLKIKNPSVTTVNYGETLVLHADVAELPEGYSIQWTVEGSGFSMTTEENGMKCKVTSVANGNASVKATLVDENGEAVLDANGNEMSDSKQLKSDASFWQKIVSFFKNLFRVSRTILQ